MKALILCLLFTFTLLAQTELLLVTNKAEASVSVINLATEKEIKRIPVEFGPHEIAIAPNNQLAVVANYGNQQANNSLSVIDLSTLSVTKTIQLEYNRPHGIRFFKDNKHLLITSESNKLIHKVNIETGKTVETYETGGFSHMVTLNEDETKAFSAAIPDGFATITDLKNKKRIRISLESGSEAIDYHPKQNQIWVGNNNLHTISVIDLNTNKRIKTIDVGVMPIRVRISKDGRHAFISTYFGGQLQVINTQTYEISATIPLFTFTLEKEDWVDKSQAEKQRITQDIIKNGARPIDILEHPSKDILFVSVRGQNHIAVINRQSYQILSRIKTGNGPDGLGYAILDE